MKRLHLVRPELGTGSVRTALILMVLIWIPLLVLCLIEGQAFRGVELPFFHDLAAQTRFLIAVPLLVLADIPVGVRLRQVVYHFLDARLVRDEELAKFEQIVMDTVRFRDARAAEMMVLLLAYVGTYNAVSGFSLQTGSTWFKSGNVLTSAGYWYALVALPIFQFLMYRWIYRMVVWSRFCGMLPNLTCSSLLPIPTRPVVSASSVKRLYLLG
jgi:hypothetical protein